MCAHLEPGQPWICGTCGKAGPIFVGLSAFDETVTMMKEGWDFTPTTGSSEVCSPECLANYGGPDAYWRLAYEGSGWKTYEPISEADIWNELASNEQESTG